MKRTVVEWRIAAVIMVWIIAYAIFPLETKEVSWLITLFVGLIATLAVGAIIVWTFIRLGCSALYWLFTGEWKL